ncbi:DMT family transporter [Bacillus sp. AFS041924]|uniref:DMT family transporter n=1 Tax=Bacillus sp. AFS041924 TaxID=2033503 RepID=UPI000BFE9BB3|nr:DMT family transporter [Bacillus sp. AFS041924]PGS56297.1 EamA family transporter [Bacillus sp. AFS041924]
MKFKDGMALFGLAALWGASFLFIRISSPVFGPFLTIQGRVTFAAFALVLYLVITKGSLHFIKRWRQYLIIGVLNAAIPFTLIATSALHLTASISSILNSLTPIFTALVVWFWSNEKLGIRKWLGIMVGVLGVILLVGWSSIPFTYNVKIAIGLAVLSTISYGIAGVYAKKAFVGVPALSLATGQQIGAAILLLPFTLLNLPTITHKVSVVAILAVLALALFCTAIAYLLYFYLIESVGPTKTLSVTFLIPVFGMIWGVLILKEHITLGMLLGFIVILCSVFLISEISLGLLTSKKRMQVLQAFRDLRK